MVVSKQKAFTFNRRFDGQHGRRFVVLAQRIGRSVHRFLRSYVVPAAKRVGAVLKEIGAPEIAEVVIARQNFKSEAESVGKQTLIK